MSVPGFRARPLPALLACVCFGLPVAATAQTNPATPPTATTPPGTPTSADPSAPSTSTPSAAAADAAPQAAAPPAASTQPPPPSGDPWATESAGAAAPSNAPPPVYYVDKVPETNEPPKQATPEVKAPPHREHRPMRLGIEEPPPPPVATHRAPRYALWLGARAGWWVPFGDLWGTCSTSGYGCDTTSFGTVASSGPMLEIDVGARLGRHYSVYLLWERAELSNGDGLYTDQSQTDAETDYVALGLRLSADPDDIGMVLDLAVGARRFAAHYEGGNELQLTDAPFESRLGVGADIRLSQTFTLSPIITLGLGSFGKAEWVTNSTVADAVPVDQDPQTHGWLTLQLGGHFDIFGTN